MSSSLWRKKEAAVDVRFKEVPLVENREPSAELHKLHFSGNNQMFVEDASVDHP